MLLAWLPGRPLTDRDQDLCVCEFVAPTYPTLARQARTQGVVHLEVAVDSAGAPNEINLVNDETPQSPHSPMLQRASVDAVKQWRFCSSPHSSNRNGSIVTVIFKLNEKSGPPEYSDSWSPTDVSFQPPATVTVTTTVSRIVAQ